MANNEDVQEGDYCCSLGNFSIMTNVTSLDLLYQRPRP